jgi:hypothetical protein
VASVLCVCMRVQSFVFLEGKLDFLCRKKGDRCVQDDIEAARALPRIDVACNSRESGASVSCVCMRMQRFVFLEGKIYFLCRNKGCRLVYDDKLRMYDFFGIFSSRGF